MVDLEGAARPTPGLLDEHSFAADFDRLVSDAPTSLLSDLEVDAEFDKFFKLARFFKSAPSCTAASLDPAVEDMRFKLEHVRINSGGSSDAIDAAATKLELLHIQQAAPSVLPSTPALAAIRKALHQRSAPAEAGVVCVASPLSLNQEAASVAASAAAKILVAAPPRKYAPPAPRYVPLCPVPYKLPIHCRGYQRTLSEKNSRKHLLTTAGWPPPADFPVSPFAVHPLRLKPPPQSAEATALHQSLKAELGPPTSPLLDAYLQASIFSRPWVSPGDLVAAEAADASTRLVAAVAARTTSEFSSGYFSPDLGPSPRCGPPLLSQSHLAIETALSCSSTSGGCGSPKHETSISLEMQDAAPSNDNARAACQAGGDWSEHDAAGPLPKNWYYSYSKTTGERVFFNYQTGECSDEVTFGLGGLSFQPHWPPAGQKRQSDKWFGLDPPPPKKAALHAASEDDTCSDADSYSDLDDNEIDWDDGDDRDEWG